MIESAQTKEEALRIAAPFLRGVDGVEQPLSINQIEQFRRSFGWTPPFGFTQSQLLQYIEDNPNATPEELEAGASGVLAGGTEIIEVEPFLDEQYFRDNFTTEELKEMAKKAGFTKGGSGAFGFLGFGVGEEGIQEYLTNLTGQIEEARGIGFSDDEILTFIKGGIEIR